MRRSHLERATIHGNYKDSDKHMSNLIKCCFFCSFNVLFDKLSSGQMSLFPDYLPTSRIIVLPNQGNHVHIPDQPSKPAFGTAEDGALLAKPTQPDLEHGCIGRLRQCANMEPKIVKYARAVLERKAAGSVADADASSDELDRRMQRMEQTIDIICRNVELIAAKLEVSLKE